MSRIDFDPKADAVTARVTATDLPEDGPVFVLCLTANDPESRRRLRQVLALAEKRDYGLWLQLITYYGEPDAEAGSKAKAAGVKQAKRQAPPQGLLPF